MAGARQQLRPGAGAILLGVMLFAALAGARLWPLPPNRTLEPAVAALAPPGARFATLHLANGAVLAADRIELRAGSGVAAGSEPAGGTWMLTTGGSQRSIDAGLVRAEAPTGEVRFWLGSDRFGRDVAARLLHGARISLAVASAAVGVSLLVGVPFGLLAGLTRGAAARALLALLESAQAFPRLFLVVVLAAVWPPSAVSTIAILGLTGWMPVTRLVRAETRKLAASDFVLAARGLGASPLRIAWRHILPGTLAPILVEASLSMAGAIAGEAALSFLGLGAPPPTASWGSLIAEGRDLVGLAPWISIAPGIALGLTVLGCNLLAERSSDRADPRRPMLAS